MSKPKLVPARRVAEYSVRLRAHRVLREQNLKLCTHRHSPIGLWIVDGAGKCVAQGLTWQTLAARFKLLEPWEVVES